MSRPIADSWTPDDNLSPFEAGIECMIITKTVLSITVLFK